MIQHTAKVGAEEHIFAKLRKYMTDATQKEAQFKVPNFSKVVVETHRLSWRDRPLLSRGGKGRIGANSKDGKKWYPELFY